MMRSNGKSDLTPFSDSRVFAYRLEGDPRALLLPTRPEGLGPWPELARGIHSYHALS